MCTLILASHALPDSSLFLASNRDERLDRPAQGPLLWPGDPAFVAPRDEEEGGTWLGVNAYGVLVAITNRFGAQRDGARRSRGALVVDALHGRDAADAAAIARDFGPEVHNPFHLVVADTTSAYAVWSDGESVRRQTLDAGVHIVTERSFGAAPNGRAEFLASRITQLEADGALDAAALAALLAVHRPNDIDATTVLLPQQNYGTRSSTLLDVSRRALRYADGPPTLVDYTDYSALVRNLLGS